MIYMKKFGGISMCKYKLKVLLTQIILILLFVFLWEIGSSNGVINSFIFSSPSKIIKTLFKLISNGTIFIHLITTFKEILIAFSLGVGISFLVSIIMYRFKFFADVIDPFLTMLNSLPKVALGPIIIIWVGANAKSIITMALLINVIISIITIYNGFINTDPLKVKLFNSLKASRFQVITKLIIPANWPTIISALKVNISLTFIGVIMGEFLVSKRGIGYLILYGTQVFDLNLVITGIFVLIILSYFIYKVLIIIENKISKLN